MPNIALAQTNPDKAREAAARDTSNWVQFPPRSTAVIPAPIAPSARPQPAAPIVTPGTSVNSRGWLVFNQPETARAPPAGATTEPSSATIASPAAPGAGALGTPHSSQPSQTAGTPAAVPAPPPVPTVKRFDISGHTVYSSAKLESHLSAWIGQPINIPSLERAVEALSALYRRDGWLAKVELPSQDLTEGAVKIQVIEAVLSGIDVQTSPQAAVKAEIPREFVVHATPLNEPLSLKNLERAGQIINELPGVESTLSLRPGQLPGETEAVVTVGDAKPHEGSVLLDNGGSRSTGNLRATGQVTLKGFWHRGDLTTVQLTKSEGLNSGRISYSEPLGGSGLRGGVFASVSRYQLALPEFSSIHAHGPSNSLGLELMYPWLRTATSSINATASLERKRFTNHANEVVASDYRSDVLTAGLNGQFQDPLQGSNSLSYQLSLGYLNLTGSPNKTSDASGAQTAGMFNKIRAQWIRQQRISDVDVLQFNWQGQWASKNLDGSEKIFLGGPQGVRAYPVNEGGASAGHVLNLEWFRQLQWDDHPPLTLSVFKDVGHATVNKYTWDTASLNKFALRGHGLSVGTAINSGLGQSQLKLTWARRLGLSPVANSTTGFDQDGTLTINRFWLTFSHFL